MKRIFVFLLLALFSVHSAAVLAAADLKKKKMCWAHYVCWGFPFQQGYDTASASDNVHQLIPYSDRSLLGKYVQENTAIWTCNRKQIESAIQWGIDGFCINIIADPSQYKPLMARFYKDAEGTDFKIALCIDKLNSSPEVAAGQLEDFIRTYKDHPNACLLDGKMVFFVYHLGQMTPDSFKKMKQELEKRGAGAYFLLQPMSEVSMWDYTERMNACSEAADGFYDFGCNGFSQKQMKTRLGNGRRYLDKYGKDRILCAGIAQGYIGQFTAFYRPYLNTESLRNSWEAAIASGSDWVCLTTWNDYIENTHFEPAVHNRSNLVRINREYLRKWRGETPPARPAHAMLTYMEEVVAGNDITLELMNFSYSSGESEAVIRVLELNGELFREFKKDLKREELCVETFRIVPDELGSRTGLRIQFSVAEKGQKHHFKELMPITRRPDWMHCVRTFRTSYDDMTGFPVQLSIEGNQVKIRLNTWVWAGKVELLRNNWPIWETEISHDGKPVAELQVPIDRDVFPEDCYVARITDSSDRIGFSNPAIRKNTASAGMKKVPVIVTNCDFDESWPLWTERPRPLGGDVQMVEFPRQNIFQVRFNMDKEVNEKLIFSDSPWKIGAVAGKKPWVYWTNEKQYMPQMKRTGGPDGKERIVWHFDGNDNLTWASRAFPHGPVTIEMWVRPESGSGILFSTAGTSLLLDEKMAVKFSRSPEANAASVLVGNKPLAANTWTHIAAVYSGSSLELFFNGTSVGTVPAKPVTFGVNAIPVIGNIQQKTAGGFLGDMAGFAVYGGIPQEGKFLLLE